MFQVGESIADQYAIERVAPGGMGVVLIVRDEFSGSLLAAKTVKDEALDSAPVIDRFRREARTWMNLGRHENLVSALFYREIADRPFLFLEYVDGVDLQILLERDSRSRCSRCWTGGCSSAGEWTRRTARSSRRDTPVSSTGT